MRLIQRLPTLFAPLGLLFAIAANVAVAQERPRSAESPRVTPTVQLVRKCLPAIVSVRVQRHGDASDAVEHGHGGGSVIHPDGYILTNEHVVAPAAGAMPPKIEVAFFQGPWRPARVVARLPSEDLALLQVAAEKPLPILPLGRSDDLELGEPVLTFGSPGGLPHSLSTGIISGLGRATNTEHAHLPKVVQTTAPISGGNSGGPLINALGQQVGVVTSRKSDGENLGFAVTVDRVREIFPQLIAAEQRFGITHGLSIETLGDRAKVNAVAPDSPAEKAGVQTGDVVLSLDQKPLRDGVDFYLALIGRAAGEKLHLGIRRGGKEMPFVITLAATPVLQPVKIDKLEPGLRATFYQGAWEKLPDFSQLKPEETVVKTSSPWFSESDRFDRFGLTLTGLIKIPADGLYLFTTVSDDGSRLWIGERLIVDNDGQHPPVTAGGLVQLKAGTYPLRIAYFDAGGEQMLRVFVEDPQGRKRRLPADWLFHQP